MFWLSAAYRKMPIRMVKSRARLFSGGEKRVDLFYIERESGNMNRGRIKSSQTRGFVSADITGLSPLFAFCLSI
jgi:hypothetical protein